MKASAGKTIEEPWVAVAMYPRMQPKQWKRGGGHTTISVGVRPMRSPIELPLFRIALWLKHAAFGMAVVPEVNWIFIVSCTSSGEDGVTAL